MELAQHRALRGFPVPLGRRVTAPLEPPICDCEVSLFIRERGYGNGNREAETC
jgi:hypothetical protein